MKYLILDYLEATASRLPEKTAFADEHTNVTFGQLVHRARAVGSALLPLVSPRSVVGFYMDKSVHTVTGFMLSLIHIYAKARRTVSLDLPVPADRFHAGTAYAAPVIKILLFLPIERGNPMSLFTLLFFSFLCAGFYYLCPLRFRPAVLLLVSYALYAYHGLNALPFILVTTASTYLGALAISRLGESSRAYLREHRDTLSAAEKKARKQRVRARQRMLFLLTLLLNFGILAALKYLEPLLGLGAALAGAVTGREPAPPALDLLLPLGISFYTFQSMGYLIDVYNGKYAAEKNPARFALYVSFFPQLIQGPIGRYDQLGPQLASGHRFDFEEIKRGALLMLWGFFKKKVIADRALPLVEEVFANQSAYGGAVIVIGVLFYSLQQYTDFSGGIDLVTGVAQLFGIRLAPNFRRPYFSVSLGEFWRRWHISLGSWMRDYVFYPFALTRPMNRLSKMLKKRVGTHMALSLIHI